MSNKVEATFHGGKRPKPLEPCMSVDPEDSEAIICVQGWDEMPHDHDWSEYLPEVIR